MKGASKLFRHTIRTSLDQLPQVSILKREDLDRVKNGKMMEVLEAQSCSWQRVRPHWAIMPLLLQPIRKTSQMLISAAVIAGHEIISLAIELRHCKILPDHRGMSCITSFQGVQLLVPLISIFATKEASGQIQ